MPSATIDNSAGEVSAVEVSDGDHINPDNPDTKKQLTKEEVSKRRLRGKLYQPLTPDKHKNHVEQMRELHKAHHEEHLRKKRVYVRTKKTSETPEQRSVRLRTNRIKKYSQEELEVIEKIKKDRDEQRVKKSIRQQNWRNRRWERETEEEAEKRRLRARECYYKRKMRNMLAGGMDFSSVEKEMKVAKIRERNRRGIRKKDRKKKTNKDTILSEVLNEVQPQLEASQNVDLVVQAVSTSAPSMFIARKGQDTSKVKDLPPPDIPVCADTVQETQDADDDLVDSYSNSSDHIEQSHTIKIVPGHVEEGFPCCDEPSGSAMTITIEIPDEISTTIVLVPSQSSHEEQDDNLVLSVDSHDISDEINQFEAPCVSPDQPVESLNGTSPCSLKNRVLQDTRTFAVPENEQKCFSSEFLAHFIYSLLIIFHYYSESS